MRFFLQYSVTFGSQHLFTILGIIKSKQEPQCRKAMSMSLRISTFALLAAAVLSAGCSSSAQKHVPQIIRAVAHTPLDQVLKQRPELLKDLATVELRQYFNTVESPTLAEVKVTETGLADDSVHTIRTIYNFKLTAGKWVQVNKSEEYRCVRGKNTKTFQTAKCS